MTFYDWKIISWYKRQKALYKDKIRLKKPDIDWFWITAVGKLHISISFLKLRLNI